MMIAPKLYIFHILIKMIRHIITDMILSKMWKKRKKLNDEEDTLQHQGGNKSGDNTETIDTSRLSTLIKKKNH